MKNSNYNFPQILHNVLNHGSSTRWAGSALNEYHDVPLPPFYTDEKGLKISKIEDYIAKCLDILFNNSDERVFARKCGTRKECLSLGSNRLHISEYAKNLYDKIIDPESILFKSIIKKKYGTASVSDILSNIHSKLLNNNILISCYSGFHASVAIICCYLIKYGNVNLEYAYNSIISKNNKLSDIKTRYMQCINNYIVLLKKK